MKTKTCPPATARAHATEHGMILFELEHAYKGKEYRCEDLAAICGIKETHKTCPNTRKLIRELIALGHPICANGYGYYMPQTGAELEEYVNVLYNRADAIHARILALLHNRLEV